MYLRICVFVFAERGDEEAETCEERETEDGQKCKSHVNLGSGHSGHCQSIGRREERSRETTSNFLERSESLSHICL